CARGGRRTSKDEQQRHEAKHGHIYRRIFPSQACAPITARDVPWVTTRSRDASAAAGQGRVRVRITDPQPQLAEDQALHTQPGFSERNFCARRVRGYVVALSNSLSVKLRPVSLPAHTASLPPVGPGPGERRRSVAHFPNASEVRRHSWAPGTGVLVKPCRTSASSCRSSRCDLYQST